MTHRSGLTLTEVLVAIFIMGIGLMSLLVLFPLAALKMQQAIKDQRAADCARIAAGIARALPTTSQGQQGLRQDPAVYNTTTGTSYYTDPTIWPIPTTNYPKLTTGSGPSYPIFVDPTGANAGALQLATLAGVPGIPRVSPSYVSGANSYPLTTSPAVRWFTLLDEMNYTPDGIPINAPTQPDRVPRYSWAYLCRQYQANNAPIASGGNIDLWVIVYDRRTALPGSAGTLQEETAWQASFNAGSNVARLTWTAGGAMPQIKTGTWMLDATMSPQINGYFYRIERATLTNPATNSWEVELNMNARASASGSTGVAVLFDSVVEVFERGP
jgi:prepilin-type N-terminal cleavage/methylation domain-containing protein